jgi:hypothetical protein
MAHLTLTDNLFLYPSPTGAYFAISEQEDNKSRQFLQNLLQAQQTPALTQAELSRLTGLDNEDQALELLYHCQQLEWVQGLKEPLMAPQKSLEEYLPSVLPALSSQKKVLLADEEGFYLGCQGFSHEAAEELSALSAELAILHHRRTGLLKNNLGINHQAWALVNAYGDSQLGFWPLYIGQYRFILVIAGIPYFNQPDFIGLAWALSIRYATNTTVNTSNSH